MLKSTREALPNRIITTLFVYIYFYQNRFSRNFNLPQGGTCKDSKSSSNRKFSGVTGVLSVTLDKLRAMPLVGTSHSGALGVRAPHTGASCVTSSAQCTLPGSPGQRFKTLHTVKSLHIYIKIVC